MVLGHAPFFGEEIQHLGSMMAAGVDGAAGGMAENIDLNAAYLDAITAAAGEITGLDDQTVIWDCGNGATGTPDRSADSKSCWSPQGPVCRG